MNRRSFLQLAAGLPLVGSLFRPVVAAAHTVESPDPGLTPYKSIVFLTTAPGVTVAVITPPGAEEPGVLFHPSGDTMFVRVGDHMVTPVVKRTLSHADFDSVQGHRMIAGDALLVNAILRGYTGADKHGPCSMGGVTFDLSRHDLQNAGLIRSPARFGHPETADEFIAHTYRLVPRKDDK